MKKKGTRSISEAIKMAWSDMDNQLAFGESSDELYKLITDYVDNLTREHEATNKD